MKTKYKYIEMFKSTYKQGKTDVYYVKNIKSQSVISKIKWYPQWRQYCLFPVPSTVYSQGCLNDISDFLEQLKQERKNNA